MKRLLTSLRALLAGLALLGVFGSISPALATTVTAVNGLSCAGTRSTTNLGCNAGEFTTIVNITNAPGAPTSCVAGEYVIYNGMVSLSGTNADRYDIGFFTGENGNDPGLNNAGNLCSVATFPTSPPLPWFAKDADACGDYEAAGVDTAVVNNIKVLCAGDATGALMVPYTLAYSQNAGIVCTGPTNVKAGSTSKCNKGIAVVPVGTFTVNGSVTVTKQTVPDGDAQSFAFTASGTGPVMSGDTSFNLTDNGSKQVRMGITDANGTLTITETATTFWEPTATIACTKPDGITPAGFVTTNGATRTITATLSNTNPNALCTITNKRAVSATNSTVVANPTSVASNGVSTSTITVTLRDTAVAGNAVAGKSVTLTAGSGSSTITTLTGVTDVNGQATFTVKDAVAESVTYTARDTTDGITINQLATVAFFSVSSFNVFETSTAANATTGRIYTKLAGTAFGLDVVAIAGGIQASGFSGNVKVELLANTGAAGSGYGANNCPTSNSVIQIIAAAAIASERATVNFAAVAASYRDVRVRITYTGVSPSVVACSTDSFAIRPAAFTITSSNATGGTAATNTGASGSPAIKAGTSFNLTATAVTGYGGTPILDATQVVGTTTAGTLSGNFGAANSATGVATGNAFTYSEVGNFGLNANAAYDSSFTSIDQGSDCTNDFSNTLVGFKYGCKVGSTAVTQSTGSSGFGRFIPDHFDTVVMGPMTCPSGLTCPAGGLVYSGQAFTTQVTAKNLAGGTTQNYDGTLGYAKRIDPADGAGKGLAAWDALGSTTTQNPSGLLTNDSITAATFSAGVATTSTPVYTLATVATAPTDIYIRAVDTDGVTSLRAASVEGGVKVVSGRIKISNAYGSELLALPMTATVQFYNATGSWVTSATDSATTFNTNKTPGGNLVPVIVKGPLALGNISVVGAGAVTVTNGVKIFTLNKPEVTGSAGISLNAPIYLLPVTGRATFGIYKSPLIYRRENY